MASEINTAAAKTFGSLIAWAAMVAGAWNAWGAWAALFAFGLGMLLAGLSDSLSEVAMHLRRS